MNELSADMKGIPGSSREAKYEIPSNLPKTIIIDNVAGHDIHVTYLLKDNPSLSLASYNPDGEVLRAEEGLGELKKNTPDEIKLWEIQKAGRAGENVDLSPPDKEFPREHVLSSQMYAFKKDTYGNMKARFLQYRRPYGQPNIPRVYGHISGVNHEGLTGREIEAVIEVHWVNGVGIIIEPTIIGGRVFQEEVKYAKSILADPHATEELSEDFVGLRERIDHLKLTTPMTLHGADEVKKAA